MGIDHELPANIVLTAQGISRRFSAFMGMVDEGSAYTPTQVTEVVNEFSGPNFGQPIAWVSPRLLRAAVRYSF